MTSEFPRTRYLIERNSRIDRSKLPARLRNPKIREIGTDDNGRPVYKGKDRVTGALSQGTRDDVVANTANASHLLESYFRERKPQS